MSLRRKSCAIRPLALRLALAAIACAAALPVAAYSPGSGTVYSDDFEADDDGWEMGNGIGQPSPWERRLDGADSSFHADGYGPFGISPTRHWARRALTPTTATSFSVAFEFRGELGNGYVFGVDFEQRAEDPRKYRFEIMANGAVRLLRLDAGSFTELAATGGGVIPADVTRWVRFAIGPDPSGHPRVQARVWDGGALAEPSGWTLDVIDTTDAIARVHRVEFEADGPKGVQTWLDDLDVFGDAGDGIASSVTEIYVAELSHLDIGFTEPPDDVAQFAKTHLDTVLNNLDADPDYRWLIECGWWLEQWWERSNATERDRMVEALQEGRLELTAGYANQTSTMVGHEEMARNLYWSTKFTREHGLPPLRTWIQDDVPGSTFAVPEILARAGVDYYVGGMNTGFGGALTLPDHGDRPFWWVGPDGSRVLSWVTFNSYAEGFQYGFSFFDNLAAMYDKLGTKLPEMEEAGYPYPELLLLRGFDNHYQGFHVRNLINQWNANYSTPVFHLLQPDEFLDMMRAKYGDESFPSFSGDFGAAWARSRAGTPHTRERIRQAHRDARAAEAVHAAASAIDGTAPPKSDLERLYRDMLESDEHTGGGGWPGYFTPEEMERNNRIHLGYATNAADNAEALVDDGVARLVADLPAQGDAVVAVNTLGRARDAWARIALPAGLYASTFKVVDRETGAEVAFQRFDATSEILVGTGTMPPFGYKVFDLVPGTPTADPPGMLSATPTSLENDAYAITIDATDGSISNLFEKATGRELVDTGSGYDFNELATNTKAQYDAQQPPVADPPTSATTTVLSTGPLVAELEVTRTGTPHVRTVYRLYRGEDRVEIENTLDRDLTAYVPQATGALAYMVTLPFDIHDFEIRTETTTRFVDPIGDSFGRANVFDYHNAEHSLTLWDANGGVAFASDDVGAHHFENLSSLASGSYSTGDALVLPRLLDRADEYEFDNGAVGPFTIEPDTPPLLTSFHHVRGTPATFDPVAVSRFGFEALTPVETRLLGRRPGNLPDDRASFVEIDAPEVLPYTLKPEEYGQGVVVRMTEMTGQALTARVRSDVLAIAAPARLEHDEEGGDPLAMDGDGFLVPLGPYETATVRFEASPDWSPIRLTVDKNVGSDTVVLDWTGGVAPYTVERAVDPQFAGPATLLDEAPATTLDDPVLSDGTTYFYLVR